MTSRQKTWAGAFFLVHFTIILCSAAKLPYPRFGSDTFHTALESYAYVSGTGYHYGFFAPGVSSQMRTTYVCKRNDVPLRDGEFELKNIETTFRLHNIMEHFWEFQFSPKERRSMAASFAAKAFTWCKEADEVELGVQAYVLPSMQATREGAKPYWEEHYRGRFRRKVNN